MSSTSKRSNGQRAAVEQSRPTGSFSRHLTIGSPKTGVLSEGRSPEATVLAFFEAWGASSYSQMAALIVNPMQVSPSHLTGRLRHEFGEFALSGFDIVAVRNMSPEEAEVDAIVRLRCRDVAIKRSVKVELQSMDDRGNVSRAESAAWKIILRSFDTVLYSA